MGDKIDFDNIQKTAWKVLMDYTNDEIPIDVFQIIKKIPNLKLKTYQRLSEITEYSLTEIIHASQSNDGALWYISGVYIIAYNKNMDAKRTRFTIAHELGHYFLNHLNLSQRNILARNPYLSDSKYNQYEHEANFFAKHLLIPFPTMSYIIEETNHINVDMIEHIYDVNFQPAHIVINNLQRSGFITGGVLADQVKNKYYPNMTYLFSTITCKKCLTPVFRGKNFCPICGSNLSEQNDDLKSLNYNILYKGVKSMEYSSINLDENSRATICPRCETEIREGDFCEICGLYIVNRCVGVSNYQEYDWISNNHSCENGKKLSDRARYCPYCGGVSSFYAQGVLSNYTDELPQEKLNLLIEQALQSN